MKRVEKINIIFHAVLCLVFIVALSLTIIFHFWCHTEAFAQLILHTTMLSGILGAICFIPAVTLCACAITQKIQSKCHIWMSFYPVILFLISSCLWVANIGYFVTFTGGV